MVVESNFEGAGFGLKVLVADDHTLARAGITMLLKDLRCDADVIEVDALGAALTQLRDGRFGVVVIDEHLPGSVINDPIAPALAIAGDAPVIVMSDEASGERVRRMLDIGARAVLPTNLPRSVTAAAFEIVLGGGTYAPPSLLDVAPVQSRLLGLTTRQMEVLRMLARGRSNKEIAASLRTSESTVRAHTSAIFKTLGVDNRTQAARIAYSHQLV